ncbi:putative transmembrane protein [Toxoplasma gondii p89]|uniref:Putative transmembrane protein n=1 Tax=Toxoplasma gondii p89 TaxID=943119 RepID=A0A086KXU6_TOXGO|nr:putative transmembrane protein [Toxoplasma gondii p89]
MARTSPAQGWPSSVSSAAILICLLLLVSFANSAEHGTSSFSWDAEEEMRALEAVRGYLERLNNGKLARLPRYGVLPPQRDATHADAAVQTVAEMGTQTN